MNASGLRGALKPLGQTYRRPRGEQLNAWVGGKVYQSGADTI